MYLTWGGSVQRLVTRGAGGGQSTMLYVGLARRFMHMCLHEKRKAMAVEKVGGG
jgi:hypothetical protein